MRRIENDIVDFHSHILPTADHGAASLDVSILQLKRAADHGIKRIIATPHFYPMKEDVDAFLQRRRCAYNVLKPALDWNSPEIKVGAEVKICTGIDHMPNIEKLFINGTQTILVELPLGEFQPEYAASVYRLVSSGVKVILAHPERYDDFAVNAMLDSGVLLQCNASALSKHSKIKRVLHWIASDSVVAIGSDIHGASRTAYSDFIKATKKLDGCIDFIKEQSDLVWNTAEFGLNN